MEGTFQILWHSWALCCHSHVEVGDLQTKGNLHYHINIRVPRKHVDVTPVLVVSSSSVIGKIYCL